MIKMYFLVVLYGGEEISRNSIKLKNWAEYGMKYITEEKMSFNYRLL